MQGLARFIAYERRVIRRALSDTVEALALGGWRNVAVSVLVWGATFLLLYLVGPDTEWASDFFIIGLYAAAAFGIVLLPVLCFNAALAPSRLDAEKDVRHAAVLAEKEAQIKALEDELESKHQFRLKPQMIAGPLCLRITNDGPEDVFSGELVKFRYNGGNTPVWHPLVWVDTGEETRVIAPGMTRELEIGRLGLRKVESGHVSSSFKARWPAGDVSDWGKRVEPVEGVYRHTWEFDLRVVAARRQEIRDVTLYVTHERSADERTGTRVREMRLEERDFGFGDGT